jgi:uncharacterized membrane protein (UPF0127 family)
MRWQRKLVRVTNRTRDVLLGDRIRVADNALTGIVGLLGERRLPAGDGLWIRPSQGVHTFGMMFSIDVLVLDADCRVIAMRAPMPPFRLTSVYWEGRSVLELPPGTAAASGTTIGDELEFTRIDVEKQGSRS